MQFKSFFGTLKRQSGRFTTDYRCKKKVLDNLQIEALLCGDLIIWFEYFRDFSYDYSIILPKSRKEGQLIE